MIKEHSTVLKIIRDEEWGRTRVWSECLIFSKFLHGSHHKPSRHYTLKKSTPITSYSYHPTPTSLVHKNRLHYSFQMTLQIYIQPKLPATRPLSTTCPSVPILLKNSAQVSKIYYNECLLPLQPHNDKFNFLLRPYNDEQLLPLQNDKDLSPLQPYSYLFSY